MSQTDAVPDAIEFTYQATLADMVAGHRLFASAAPAVVRKRGWRGRLRALLIVYGLIAAFAGLIALLDWSGLVVGQAVSTQAVLGACGGVVACVALFRGFSPAILRADARRAYERGTPAVRHGPVPVTVRLSPSAIEVRRPGQVTIHQKSANAMIAELGDFYIVHTDVPFLAIPRRAIDDRLLPAFTAVAAPWGLAKRNPPPRMRILAAAMLLLGPLFLAITLFQDHSGAAKPPASLAVTLPARDIDLPDRRARAGAQTLSVTTERGGLVSHLHGDVALDDSDGGFDVYDSRQGYSRRGPVDELAALGLTGPSAAGAAATLTANGDVVLTWPRAADLLGRDHCAVAVAYRTPAGKGFERVIYARLCTAAAGAPGLADTAVALAGVADAAFDAAVKR